MIIMHGLLGTLDNWMNIAKRISADAAVYLLDLRNHGRSPHSEELDFDMMVDDLAEFIANHHLENTVIAGHSLGGRVAMRFALARPDEVGGLIVADISPKTHLTANAELLPKVIETMQEMPLSDIKTRKEAEEYLVDLVPDPAARQFLLKNLMRKKDHSFAWKPNLDVIKANLHLISGGIESKERFEKPALFLRGENSDYILAEDEARILELFPAAKITTIPKAGHWLHADAPERVAGEILDFLGREHF